MIMPLNLVRIDDKQFVNICIKHINSGLLVGVDYLLSQEDASNEELFQYFPRGFYGNCRVELIRIKDILTSKMLYILGDFDKYVIMTALNAYMDGCVSDYDMKTAEQFLEYSDDKVRNLSKSLNYYPIRNKADRDYVLNKVVLYCKDLASTTDFIMASLEDFNQYIDTCFCDIDFLNLGDFTIKELKALSTMKEYMSMGIEIEETHLHLPYAVIK